MPKGSIDHCTDCGTRLKNTKHERQKEAQCTMCGSNHISQNMRVSELTRELQVRNSNMTFEELEISENAFEDSPVALREEEYGRVSKNSSVVSSWGMSALSEIMTETDTNKYRLTHGSATNGTRYTYKKRKAE